MHINTDDIGPRMFVEHGFATIITAKSIGSDFWVNQQVTIGWNYDKAPVLGNGVRVAAGAKIIGGVTLGDNCIIGANGVVTKDVPPEEVWGGFRFAYRREPRPQTVRTRRMTPALCY